MTLVERTRRVVRFTALGEKVKAVAAYEKALSFKAGLSSKMKSDAEAQMKALGR